MGAYLTLPVNTEIHDQPDWVITGGYINQDTDTVYISCGTNDPGASFSYRNMWVQLVLHHTNGTLEYRRVAGVSGSGQDIYEPFSGTLTSAGLNNRDVDYVYLAMRCSTWTDSNHSNHCKIGEGAGDTDPGYSIPGTTLYLQHTVPPAIGNLRNNSPYNGNSGVSSSTNSIAVAYDWVGGDAIDTCWYGLNNTGWKVTPTGNGYFTITGLQPGTTYQISAKASNEAGDSNRLDIWVRTRYDAPTVSSNISNIGLEGFRINWSSNRTMKSIRYKIDNVRDWTSTNVNATSGYIDVTNLSPATTYTVRVSGYSSDNYDGILSNEVTLTVTTLEIGKITSISEITHGTSFTVNITNPSNTNCTLKMWVTGNGDTTTVSKDTKATLTVTFTESEWDSIYRKYPAANTVTLNAQLTTHGIKDYNDTTKTQIITLTGIQKTAHFGVSNKPRRVQVWVGDSSGKARRAVAWVGAGGETKRTI